MKITFPRIGNVHIAARILLRRLEVNTIMPGANTWENFKKGSSISPDEICLPFRMMAGNLKDAAERGADTVIMIATMGPCRLGEYSEVLYSALKKEGYRLNWVLLDSPKVIGRSEFMKRIACFNRGREFSSFALLRLLWQTVVLVRRIDAWEQECFFTAAYLRSPGRCIRMRHSVLKKLERASDFKDAEKILSHSLRQLNLMKRSADADPIRVLLTGEIYTVIDSFGNKNIEDILMDMGVSFQKGMSLSGWMDQVIMPAWLKRRSNHKYLRHMVGGYAHHTVRGAADSERMGFDGVVHLLPSGCMPEIVAEQPLERLRSDGKTEFITLVMDENQSAEGYMTRLEAFVDMLKAKRDRGE